MSELCLYNTLSREKEQFEPLDPELVRIYSCGPTVYSYQHIGNMRPYVFADLLKRTLLYNGYRVRHVINVTDVGHLTDDADSGEDKMEVAARESGMDIWQVAEKYTALYKADLEKLRILGPDVWCKATDHIPQQIEMIRALEEKGFTYRTDDGIYFDVSKDPGYGRLARIDLSSLRAGERIEKAGQKRHSADFALWKLSPSEGTARQMEWESPWGVGFPGWHIECSAMSHAYLGLPFDIHTGGVDHVPVHHVNEIAQSENCFEVRPCVRTWMHEEFLTFEGVKISKSTGGLYTLGDLVEMGIEPLAFRFFLLGAHYRQQQTVTDEALGQARTAYWRLARHAVELRDAASGSAAAAEGDPSAEQFSLRFLAAVNDDLNLPQALAVVWDLVRSSECEPATKWALLQDFDRVLGLGLAEARIESGEIDAEIEALIEERNRARANRDFARADEIRDQLEARGILLEDGSQGTRWRRA